MKKERRRSAAADHVATLAARGRYHFVSSEARSALGVSTDAVKLALNRLVKRKILASPARGFYVIVPPEYRSLGCLPADQFIPELMKRLGLSYYVGLLSAAQYHGAAHHRPQEFQVFLARNRRPIECGAVRVAFLARKRIDEVPLQRFNTPRGTILVSTPEATALDLVGYHRHAGGFDHVATVLQELAEKVDPEKLAAAAPTVPIPWAQRLGYLLELVDGDKVSPLRTYVRKHARQSTPLLASEPHDNAARHDEWQLHVNAAVEAKS